MTKKNSFIIFMKIRCILFLCLFHISTANGQSAMLNRYITEGLNHNLTLQNLQHNYNSSLLALETAKGMYYPYISLIARHSTAHGGRTIDLPIGDMLNPVYTTLNQLTANMPPSQQFPPMSVNNEEIVFFRPVEQETKLELIQPIYNPAIVYNKRAKTLQAEAKAVEVNDYKRELIAEIKKAYFNYMAVMAVDRILWESEKLLLENLRMNEKLVENGVATTEAIWQSKAELAKIRVSKAEQQQQIKLTRAWFNFLLNRDIQTPVLIDTLMETSNIQSLYIPDTTGVRDDLVYIDLQLEAIDHAIKAKRAALRPTVYGIINYGIQGETYRFTDEDDFVLSSVILKWDLFKGNQNRLEMEQYQIKKEQIKNNRVQLAYKINMEIMEAEEAIHTSLIRLEEAKLSLIAAQKTFESVSKRYALGQAMMIEYIQARTDYSAAAIAESIAEYTFYISIADYERAAAIIDPKHYAKNNHYENQ